MEFYIPPEPAEDFTVNPDMYYTFSPNNESSNSLCKHV